MADDRLEKRVEQLEANQEAEGEKAEDIVIVIQHEDTVVDEVSGEKRRVPVKPDSFIDSEWEDAGRGNRVMVRTPLYNGSKDPHNASDHGIKPTPEETK